MAEAESDAARCRGLTADGERCSRTAGDDGFCHQHDESGRTVDDAETSGDAPAGDRNEAADTMSTETTEAEAEEEDESTAETQSNEASAESNVDTADAPVADVDESTGEAANDDATGGASTGGEADLWDARETAERVADELIEDPFDGIIEISPADEGEGWTVIVEVIERSSIPDTQDILGRYEVTVGADGGLEGYRLTGRYRRGDVSDEQAPDR